MNSETTIERIVMRRVNAVHTLRPLFTNAMLAFIVFVLALYGVGREVWVSKVFQNAPHTDVLAALRFFIAAFIDTRTIVQVLILAALLGFVWFVRDIARTITLNSSLVGA